MEVLQRKSQPAIGAAQRIQPPRQVEAHREQHARAARTPDTSLPRGPAEVAPPQHVRHRRFIPGDADAGIGEADRLAHGRDRGEAVRGES